MELTVEREVRCGPDALFALATDPRRMRAWSTAEVRSVAPGDGDHVAGVGALREVVLPAPLSRTLEEVVVVSEPPERFVYRVVRGGPIEDHRGRMEFIPAPAGARLVWRVSARLPNRAVEAVARRLLARELDRSLDRLAAAAPTADASPALPPRRSLDERASLPELYREAEAVRDEQRALAEELLAARDPRAWFTRAYEHVSTLQLDACRRGQFEHPAWVLRVVRRFHHYYASALDRSLARVPGAPEEHWREAFDRMHAKRGRRTRRFDEMARGVLHGMRAHIEEDLPRALAEVYVQSYRGQCSYARFRADYLAMGPIFFEAGERVMTDLEPSEVPATLRLALAVAPRRRRERMLARELYDIPRRRREAFERGARLVKLIDGVVADR